MKKPKLIISLILIIAGIIVFTIMAILIHQNYLRFGIRDGYTFGEYFKEEAFAIYDFGGMTIASIACISLGLFFGLLWDFFVWIRKTEFWAKYGEYMPIIITVFLVLILVVSCNAITGGGSSNGDQCGVCGGSGYVNDGFIDFKTCPVCTGSGVDFH